MGLPFPINGAHYDNGMEFINEPLFTLCPERHIEATRARLYNKNDNCLRTSGPSETENLWMLCVKPLDTFGSTQWKNAPP
jgi:hypothetical protein